MAQDIWCEAHKRFYGRPEAWQHEKCNVAISDHGNAAGNVESVERDTLPSDSLKATPKQRWSRDAYNAYQKEYMKRKRASEKESKPA